MQFVNNRDVFTRNTEVHNESTRQNINLFPQSISLTKVQKGPYYSGMKICNHLPKKLKQLPSDQKFFGPAFLCANSAYSMEEYFNYKC
jgi:hypothetical protein